MTTLKVLHLQKSKGIGGSERYLLSLLPALAGRGIDVRMIVLGAGDYRRFTDLLADARVDVKVLPAGPHLNPLIPLRLIREIRNWKPDVVHSHLIHGDLYGQLAARLTNVPGVTTFHGSHPFYRRFPYRTAARLGGRLARRTIAVSHHVAGFLRETGIARSGAVRVVHIGIDASLWMVDDDRRSAVTQGLGISDGEIVVGAVSRLVPQKGHDFLLDAFAIALPDLPGLRLLIAGDGPLRPQLEARASHLPPEAVRFLGYVENVPSFLSACDFVVFPTMPGFGEGFGVGALESMAAGRPVVASAIDSLPEIVVHDESGLLVTPGDLEGLARAMMTLAIESGVRKRLGAQARDRVEQMFPLDKMVEETVAVYNEVISG